MMHVACTPDELLNIETLLYHTKDGEGNYVLLRRRIYTDGDYIGLVYRMHNDDICFWTQTGVSILAPTYFVAVEVSGHLVTTGMSCPEFIKDDIKTRIKDNARSR